MATLHKLSVGDPTEVNPKDFFSDICPKILELQAEPCAQLGGAYGIQLFGDAGGAWTLDFPTAKVSDGIADGVDLYLEMDVDDFKTMMKGNLDIQASVLAGKIRFEGDPKLFGNLAAVLQPSE